jgi:hypothetical protein
MAAPTEIPKSRYHALTPLTEAVQKRHKLAHSANQYIEQERTKLSKMSRDQALEQQERVTLRDEEDRDASIRLLDGDEAAPRNTKRINRLAKLDETAPVHSVAIRLQVSRVQAAETAALEAEGLLIAPVLDLVDHMQTDAQGTLRQALAELSEPLAQLVAADQIKNATIGERFSVPAGRSVPFGGLAVVRSFLKSLPERLRPPDLDEQKLFDAAHQISSKILNEIKES